MVPEVRAQFHQSGRQFSKLFNAVRARVVRWEWYSDVHFPVDPTYFDYNSTERSGRLLKAEPDLKLDKVRYGFDSTSKIILAETSSTFIEIREYRGQWTDVTVYRTDGSGLNAQRLICRGKRPVAIINCDEHRFSVDGYVYSGNQIVSIVRADTAELCRIPPRDRSEISFSIREFRPQINVTEREVKEDAVLDLRDDIRDVEGLISLAAANFAKMQRLSSSKKAQPVSGIELIFQYWAEGDGPYVAMNIDTRPQHLPDWMWTHNFFKMLKRPRWAKFFAIATETDRAGIMIDARGKRHRSSEGDRRIEKWIGEMLTEAMKLAREKGAFRPLLTQEKCELGVVDIEGVFAWPKQGGRTQDNLL
jgi:hypothetical protein